MTDDPDLELTRDQREQLESLATWTNEALAMQLRTLATGGRRLANEGAKYPDWYRTLQTYLTAAADRLDGTLSPAHGIAHGRDKFEGEPGARNPCATDGHYDPDHTGICILCCALLGEEATQTQK